MTKIIGIFILLSLSLYANSFSLTIGVSGGNLEGTSNDVNKIDKLLKNKKVKNRVKLINKDATKEKIINALQEIVDRAKEGDRVYFFFSGHGTNGYDGSTNKELRLKLKTTGALLPYGAKLNYASLLVIKRDLAPLFKTLDSHGVRTVIMLDACFSGSSYKNNFSDFPKVLTQEFDKKYPYEYILFLSSSTKLEPSAESDKDKRGYFSMALTNCLKSNKSFNTLRSCIIREYDFTPTLLPSTSNQLIFK